MVNNPGNIISFKDAFVEIATHLSYSGFPVPSIIPGISLNCLTTSFTISMAALPTAFIAMQRILLAPFHQQITWLIPVL